MDKHLTEAWSSLDPAQRAKSFSKILAITNEDLPIIPLYFPTTAVVTPKWMTGMVNPKRWGNSTLWIENWRAK
jgi:ABC-type transport system substrate-binding protein